MTDLTIAICTHNRSDQLQVTLDALLACKSAFTCTDQILVIDNNSVDNTKQLVGRMIRIAKDAGLSMRYVFEEKLGLSEARNRALKELETGFIIFFDDDISPSVDTIDAYRSALGLYPDTSIFGGKILVDWGQKKPVWYCNEPLPLIDGLIGNYDLGDRSRPYSNNIEEQFPYGANFGLRSQVARDVGGFDPLLGIKGNEIGRGEESDYIFRALKAGFKGRYLPKAMVKHRFQTERITVPYLYRYGVQKGLALSVSETSLVNWRLGMIDQLLRGGGQLIKGRIDRFYQCIINVGIFRGIGKLAK